MTIGQFLIFFSGWLVAVVFAAAWYRAIDRAHYAEAAYIAHVRTYGPRKV